MMIRRKKDKVRNDGCVSTVPKKRRQAVSKKIDAVSKKRQAVSKKRRQTCILCGPTDNMRCQFPKWETIRKEWIRFCERLTFNNNKKPLNPETARVCLVHFEADCIRRNQGGKIIGVRPKAIPTIYTPDQIHRLKDLTKCSDTNAEPDLTMTIRDAFKCIIPKATVGLLNTELQMTSEDPVIECRTANESEAYNKENEVYPSKPTSVVDHEKSEEETKISEESAVSDSQAEGNSSDAESIGNLSTPKTLRHTNRIAKTSTPTSSRSKCCVGTPSTPLSSSPRPSTARRHPVRFIRDISFTDLESPRSRRNCVNVMHHESKVMKNKIHILQKQNQRLKNKVRNLKESLENFKKANLFSRERLDELMGSVWHT